MRRLGEQEKQGSPGRRRRRRSGGLRLRIGGARGRVKASFQLPRRLAADVEVEVDQEFRGPVENRSRHVSLLGVA